MADKGVSEQNFLRLFLGGTQQGVNTLQQRQTMQQQQQPDLMLALQQMLQRKQIFEREAAQRQQALDLDREQFAFDKEQASVARARQGNVDIYNMFKDWRERTNEGVKLKADLAKDAAMMKYYEALAGKAGADAAGGVNLSNVRQSLMALLKSEEDTPENYEWLDEKGYTKLPAPLRTAYSAHFAKDAEGSDIIRYRKLRPGVAQKIAGYKALLESMGGIEQQTGLGAAPANTFPVDNDEADAYFQSLYEGAGE